MESRIEANLGSILREMAERTDKHPLNVKGKFYNDLSCIDCGLCPEIAPAHFRRDDEGGYSYLFQQPRNSEEESLLREAMSSCPTESIGDDGEALAEHFPELQGHDEDNGESDKDADGEERSLS